MPSINDYKKELEQLLNTLNKVKEIANSAQSIFETLNKTFDETGFASGFASTQLNNLRTTIEMNSKAAEVFEARISSVKRQLQDLTGMFPQLGTGISGFGQQPLLTQGRGRPVDPATGSTIYGGPGTIGTGPQINVQDPAMAFEDKYRKMWEEAGRVIDEGAKAPAKEFETQWRQLWGEAEQIIRESMRTARAAPFDAAASMDASMPGTKKKYRVESLRYQEELKKPTPGGVPDVSREELAALGPAYESAIKKAEEYGFTIDNLKGSNQEYSTGITTMRFQLEKLPGVFQNLSITTDRFGNVLQDQQKRFRGFFSTIGRNIQEAIKWSIAIQLVWGPLKKVGELVEIMIQNEAKLADVTISLGEAQSEVNNIFKVASDVAKETGESIHGVLQGYELAVRATGGIKDETQRLEAAQTLLKNSMILSKLSTLEQAQAMDTLAGAQRQLGLGFDEGITLIDSWVAVSKRANVSVETLAESFAITSSSASSAGLSLHELNGIITVVAENTTLSATEAGNAVRAFISGFQTDKAQKELSNFGIAVESSTGEALGFYDVMMEINNLFTAGIISESQLNKIGEAIGGGARRGAQVVATIKDLGRVQEVAAISALAHGDAEEALGIKLDTVQTKLVNLGNAFQRLAQTLGEDSGLLELFKSLLGISESLVDSISTLSSVLGSSLPVILGVALALGQINKAGGMAVGGLLGGMAAGGAGTAMAGIKKGAMGIYGKTGLALPAIATSATMNLIQGEEGAALGNVIGGAIGMAAGFALGGQVGATIGATIGLAIGDAFVTNVYQHKIEFADFFRDTRSQAEKERDLPDRPETLKTREEAIAEQVELLTREIQTTAGTGNIIAAQFAKNIIIGLSNIFRPEEEDVGYKSSAQIALIGAAPEQKERLELLRNLTTERKEPTAIESTQIELAREYIDYLSIIKDKLYEQLDTQIVLGEISDKQYNDSRDSLVGIVTNVTKLYSSIGDLNAPASEVKTQFSELAEIITYMSDEERAMITALIGDLNILQGTLETIKEAGGEITIGDEVLNLEDIQKELDFTTERVKIYISKIKELQSIKEIPDLLPVIDFTGATTAQLDQVLKEARTEVSREFNAGVKEGLYEGVLESDITSTFPDLLVDLGPEVGFVLVSGVRQSSLAEAIAEQVEAGAIAGMGGLSLKDFRDMTGAEFQARAAESVRMAEILNEAFPGLELDTEGIVAATATGFEQANVNLFILQMLMKDLIDVSEKQLEGVYNLPTDASFYVPFTGYALGQGAGGGLGGSMDALIAALNNLAQVEEQRILTSQGDFAGRTERIMEREDRSTILKESQITQTQANQWWETIARAIGQPSTFFKEPEKSISDRFQWQQSEPEDVSVAERFTTSTESYMSFFKSIIDSLSTAWWNNFEQYSSGTGFFQGAGTKTDQAGELKSLDKAIDALNKSRSEIGLKLDINSTTVLQLDGQVVAEVVKNYLYEDLLRQEDTATSISRSVVI